MFLILHDHIFLMTWLRSVSPIRSSKIGQFKTHSGVLIDYLYMDNKSDITLVFINGWATTHEFEWSHQTKLPFNLVFHNSRGHGRSTIDSSPFLDSAANDLSELLEHLDIRSAHFVAHSMGSLILTIYATQNPTALDIKSLTFVCPPAGNPLTTFPLRSLRPGNLDPLLESFDGGVLGRLADFTHSVRLLRSLLHLATRGGGVNVGSEQFDFLLDNVLVRREGVRFALQSMVRDGDRVGALMDTIRHPSLLISGGRDFFVRATSIDEIRRRIPHATHAHFPDATHAPMFESAAHFNRTLAEFVIRADVQTDSPLPRAG